MYVTTEITIDFQRPRQNTMQVVQDDTTRKIRLVLKDGGNDFNVSADLASGDSVVGAVAYLKPDGHGGVYDTTEDGDTAVQLVSGTTNQFDVLLVGQVFTAAGWTQVNIKFYNADFSKVLSTFAIDVNVQRNAASDYESEDYSNMQSLGAIRAEMVAFEATVRDELASISSNPEFAYITIKNSDQENGITVSQTAASVLSFAGATPQTKPVLRNIAGPVMNNDAATKAYVDAADAAQAQQAAETYLPKENPAATGKLTVGGELTVADTLGNEVHVQAGSGNAMVLQGGSNHAGPVEIKGVGTPTADSSAAPKGYVDTQIAGVNKILLYDGTISATAGDTAALSTTSFSPQNAILGDVVVGTNGYTASVQTKLTPTMFVVRSTGQQFAPGVGELKSANPALLPLTFTLTQNKMIDGTDGVERASNASRYASDAVNVENLTKINLYSAFRGNYGAAFYDEHNAFISGVVAASGYNEQPHLYCLDVPAGAKYFRFTVYVVNMPYTDAYLGIPSTHNDFNNYIVALNSNNKSEYSLPFTLTSQKMIDGTSGNEYSASASYSASNQVNVEGLTRISLYSAFSTGYGCAFYDSNGVYISGEVAADGYNQQPYTYELDVPSTAKYFRFTVCSVNMPASRATLKVPTAQTDIVNSIKALKNTKVSKDSPITDLPVYIKNNLATKDMGPLSKGYILLSFDDGANTLATGTIPLLIENNVPGSFGLLPQSEIFAAGNESHLATVVDAIENHGCAVAMHGSAQWPTYAESALNAYFDSTIALFAEKGLGGTYGAICPGGLGDDTSVLVKAIAGGYFGYVFSGNRTNKISYDTITADGKFNGPRSNRFDLDRCSGIGITSAKAETLVAFAAEHHLILCPFWHDNTLNNVNHPEYVTQFNALIAAAKSAGLTFITTADLPSIV